MEINDHIKAVIWVCICWMFVIVAHEIIDYHFIIEYLIVIPIGVVFMSFMEWLLEFRIGQYIRRMIE